MALGSFHTIAIHRTLPVVAGYVQVPPNRESKKQALTAESVLSISRSYRLFTLSGSGGHSTAGARYGHQELIELPGVAVDGVDSNYNAIKALV